MRLRCEQERSDAKNGRHLLLLSVDARSSRPSETLSRDGGCFSDEQSSTGTLSVVLDVDVVGHTRIAGATARERCQHHTVVELERAKGEALENVLG